MRPGLGASAFCGVVALTMLASKSFDPRAMWDAAGLNPPLEPNAHETNGDDAEPGLVAA